jgi:hypothetical protein
MIGLDAVRALALALPETTERTSFGTPAFFVKNKLFGRMREDGELFVLRTGFFERDALIASAPEIYSTTPHYKDYPSVLVRLATVDPEEFRELLIESWRFVAPKRLLATFDAARNQPVP